MTAGTHNQLVNEVRTVTPARLRLKLNATLVRERIQPNNGEVGLVGLENVESWTGGLIEAEESFEVGGISTPFQVGDVLFGKLRPYLAKVHVARCAGLASTELLVIRPGPALDPDFLAYQLLSPSFISEINSWTFGTKMPRVDPDRFMSAEILVPPVEKQREIVRFLDERTSQIDALLSAKQRMLALLAEKRRALVTHAVTRGLYPLAPLRDSGIHWLGEIPAHWTLCQLKRVLGSLDYGISAPVDVTGSVAVLRMGDMRDGELDYTNVGFVDSVEAPLLLTPGDLLFNRTNSLDQIGKVALFRGRSEYPVSFASYLVRLRCRPSVSAHFLNWLLNSAYPLAWGRSEALLAIGQANLNPTRYSRLPIAVPPLAEQIAIASYLANSTQEINALRIATERTISLLKERRSALITGAVTGQIDVSEAA